MSWRDWLTGWQVWYHAFRVQRYPAGSTSLQHLNVSTMLENLVHDGCNNLTLWYYLISCVACIKLLVLSYQVIVLCMSCDICSVSFWLVHIWAGPNIMCSLALIFHFIHLNEVEAINWTHFITVVGCGVSEADLESINIKVGRWGMSMSSSTYTLSLLRAVALMQRCMDRCIVNVWKAFGALKESVFRECELTINTKKMLYHACVLSLSVLLYMAMNAGYHWEGTWRGWSRFTTGVYALCWGSEMAGTHFLRAGAWWGDTETITTLIIEREANSSRVVH